MDDIFTQYCNLPCSIHAYVVRSLDGSYTIVINSRLNHETQLAAYAHEFRHIQDKDFDKDCGVDSIEYYTHYYNDSR